MFQYNLILLKIERYITNYCTKLSKMLICETNHDILLELSLKIVLPLTYKAFLCFPRFFPFKQEGKSKGVAIACLQKLKAMLMLSPAVQTSNFSRAELNANELKQRTWVISIRFGTWKVRPEQRFSVTNAHVQTIICTQLFAGK